MTFVSIHRTIAFAALTLFILGIVLAGVPAHAQRQGGPTPRSAEQSRYNRGGRSNRRGQTNPNGQTNSGGYGTGTQAAPLPPPGPVDVDEFVNAAPALSADGVMFVGSWNHELLALDQKTGAIRWKFMTGNIINASPTLGSDGTLYVTSRDKNLYALDSKTGKKKWQFATGGPLNTSPAVSPDGIVYLSTFDKKVIALDAKTGAKKWEQATQIAPSTPALGLHNLVYVSANKLYALDGATGTVKWQKDMGLLQSEAPTTGPDGTVYVGTANASVLAVNGATGQILWEFPTEHSVDYPVVLGRDGTIYASAQKLFAIRASNGKERWELSGFGSTWSAPTLGANGLLYAGYNDSNMYALDAGTGRTRWQFDTGDGLLCFPSVSSDGSVFFQCEGDSKVYALNWQSGRPRWVADQDPLPSAVQPVVADTSASGRG